MAGACIAWAIRNVAVSSSLHHAGVWRPAAVESLRLRYRLKYITATQSSQRGSLRNSTLDILAIANAAISLILDVIFVCSPLLPAIPKLHIPLRRKVGVAGVFSLGGLCYLVAAARLYAVYIDTYTFKPAESNSFAEFSKLRLRYYALPDHS